MKKRIASRIVAIILSVALVFSSNVVAFADYVTTSLTGTSVLNNNWMSGISDNALLSDVSIPGTHDSGTKYIATPAAGAWSTTQSMTVLEQLNAGVRYLDIRLAYDSTVEGSLKLVHSSIVCVDNTGNVLSFRAVVNDLYYFLKMNPTETVIVSVKEDAGNAASTIAQIIEDMIDLYPDNWYTNSSVPTMKKARGKIVLFSRIRQISRGISTNWGDQGSDGGAVDSYWYKVQDRYNMGVNNKWANAVKPMLDETKRSGIWYINFLSTTGGGIDGVGPNSSTMNGNFMRYEARNDKCYGIVCFDYIDEALSKKVYKCNDLVAKTQPNSQKGQYYYRVNLNTTKNVADGWTSVQLKLYYKPENGTGTEKSVLIFDSTSKYNGYSYVCSVGNFDFTGVVNGFPTRLEFCYDWGYGAKTLAQNQRLYVGGAPGENMTLVAKNDFEGSSGTSTPYVGIEYYNVLAINYPKPSQIVFSNPEKETLRVPDPVSVLQEKYIEAATVYDQYGVAWTQGPTSYTLTDVPEGVVLSDNVISVDKFANNNPKNTTFSIVAKYQGDGVLLSTSKELELATNKLVYRFLNYDGTMLAQGSDYAGITPEYTGEAPVMPSTQQCHYTFRGWDNNEPLSLSNTEYVAKYTMSQHNISRIEHTATPSCNEAGYDTYYCDCGYSWTTTVSALGHNLRERRAEPTCTEDGYSQMYCIRCTYEAEKKILSATGHDVENAILGEYVGATSQVNGYQTYVCPKDRVELVELRQYDKNDWSGYNEAVKSVNDIMEDSAYLGFDEGAREDFEDEIFQIRQIESLDEKTVLQVNIDAAASAILSAIDAFGDATSVKYYTVSFVKADGTVINTRYKNGTPYTEISKPENTPYLVTDEEHTVYKWGNVRNVTGDATYREFAVTSKHTFDTFIFPTSTTSPTCTEKGTTVRKCLCGYTAVDYEDQLGHDFGDWMSKGDGTHTMYCSRDKEHTITMDCTFDESYQCTSCGYSLDFSALDSIIAEAQELLALDYAYTAISLASLGDAIDRAIEGKDAVKSQAEIDFYASDIQDSINALVSLKCTVSFFVCFDDEIVDLSRDSYTGIEEVLSAPELLLNGGTVYKWTAEYLDGSVRRISGDESITVTAGEPLVYVAHIEGNRSGAVDIAKVTLLSKNNKIMASVLVPAGEYEVAFDGEYIHIGDVLIKGESLPFYDISYDLPQTVNITDGLIITANYTAR